MKKWKCQRMTRMISLYVAGDLPVASERTTAAHLATCDACHRLAGEFSENRNLLIQSCALPELGADFYAEIRRTVFAEIASDRELSKPSLFGVGWVYATSFAVAIVVSGIMLQSQRTAPEKPRDLAFKPPVSDVAVLGKRAGGVPTTVPGLSEFPRSPRKSRRVMGERKPDLFDMNRTVRDKALEIRRAMQSSMTAVSVAALIVNPQSLSLHGGSSLRSAAPEVTRIEIRTADPNIRIIWFAPRQAGSGEIDHDRHENENGDRK